MRKFLFLMVILFGFNLSNGNAQDDLEPFLSFNGMFDLRMGVRTQEDPHEKDMSLGEFRLQLETEKDFDLVTFNVATDFILDPILDEYEVDLERGDGIIDLRQMNIIFSPLDFMDVKLGRQILTWGTGDLLFINDLFAKDWNSFLIGRDEEYLKAPTDAVQLSLFSDRINMNLVYVPKFGADRFVDGRRVSFFDPLAASLRGRNRPLEVNRPDKWFQDDELAIRLYRSFAAYEVALYYYSGFWKSPAGQYIISAKATFPALEAFGASIRGPWADGIGNVEIGYYKSETGAAKNPLIRNSEFRFLVGYEREIATELTLSLQYNLERNLDYMDYLQNLPQSVLREDKARHVVTVRLTKLLMQQNLSLSLFNFYSPSDEDGFLRMNISYKISDAIKVESGSNIFYGKNQESFYAQFRNNSNIFAAIRYEY